MDDHTLGMYFLAEAYEGGGTRNVAKHTASRSDEYICGILEVLWKIWRENRDLRLTQLLVNAIPLSDPCPSVYYRNDKDVINDLKKFYEVEE